jgi:site-specific DNA-methyltransferase (adenine-specific)
MTNPNGQLKNLNQVHYTSNSDEWGTPDAFMEVLNQRFGDFTLDPCCTINSAKAPNFITSNENGLTKDWSGNVYMNPPYSSVSKWIDKAIFETASGNTDRVVCLVPARTATKWFYRAAIEASEVLFVHGRLSFENPVNKNKNSAPFPSVVIVFEKKSALTPLSGAKFGFLGRTL